MPDVHILGVEVPLDTVRGAVSEALRQGGYLPPGVTLTCSDLQSPANAPVIRDAIRDLIMGIVEPLFESVGTSCGKFNAVDLVTRLVTGAVQEQGFPYNAIVAEGVNQALCAVIAGTLRAFDFTGQFIDPVFDALVNACRAAGEGIVNEGYGVDAFEPTPEPLVLQSPTQDVTGPPTGTVVVTRTSVPRPDSGSTSGSNVWAPTTVSKKTNMVPLAIAGGVALAVSAVILSRR